MGGAAQAMPTDYDEISDQWSLAIAPAAWAFWIWAVIYPFLGFFTIYQALPESWFSWAFTRNDDLIFNQINILFAINMVSNAAWQLIYLTNSMAGMVISCLDVFVMLGTAIYMIWVSVRSTNNWLEAIVIRTGFSIYAGWLTAATILNVSFVLLGFGLKGPGLFLSEETFGCIMIWVAFAIYNFTAYWDRNPVYGLVFLWANGAIYERVTREKSQMTNLSLQSLIALCLHAASMLGLTSYLVFDWVQDNFLGLYAPLDFWKHGLFYELTW